MEVLWERFPKGLPFPVHRHKECEQFYLVLVGEAEVTLGDRVERVQGIGSIHSQKH